MLMIKSDGRVGTTSADRQVPGQACNSYGGSWKFPERIGLTDGGFACFPSVLYLLVLDD